jgi:hypothetical protein
MPNPLLTSAIVHGLLCAGLAAPAIAADVSVTTHIERVTLTADDVNGGCMAKLFDPPQDLLPGCAPDWVSFDCAGELTQPLRAYRLIDQAQLALITGSDVEVWFTDDFLFDGHCYAYRIDVYDQP